MAFAQPGFAVHNESAWLPDSIFPLRCKVTGILSDFPVGRATASSCTFQRSQSQVLEKWKKKWSCQSGDTKTKGIVHSERHLRER